MNTPTHVLVAAAALMRPAAPRANAAVLIGALLPDVSIYILYLWARVIEGLPSMEVWRVIYWQEPWQTLSAICNSIPLYLVALAIAVYAGPRWLFLLAAAALLHVGLDLPVHNSDAHRHFWPLSDWRFNSPVSYWNSDHHGDIVRPIEFAAALAMIVVLWRRFHLTTTRSLLALCALSYFAVPAYFMFTLG